MKPGRNDPCPCGSGKKYKKCCYLREQSPTAENSLKPQNLRDTRKDDFLSTPETLLEAINSLRSFVLDKKPHIKEYHKIRKLHTEIANAMIQYYYDGKFEQKLDTSDVTKSNQRHTAYLLESEFDMTTRAGEYAFYDMLIYKPASNMNSITEAFIQNNRYKKLEKIDFLHNMLDSKLGLFEITGVDPDEGYAFLKEVFTGEEYKIIDVGLSGNRNNDEFYIYTRIITYHGISFGTGLNFIFDKTDNFIQNYIQQHKNDYSPNGEFLRFTQLYNRYSKHPGKIKAVTNT